MSAAHFALDRDAAKQLFGRRDPQQLREFVQQELFARPAGDDRLDVELWRELERLLQAAGDEESRPALSHVFLGGRPLDAGEDLQLRLIRPDIVGHIAAALANISPAEVSRVTETSNFAAGDADSLTAALEQLRAFFEGAFQRRDAVVFCCPEREGGDMDPVD